MITSVKMNKYRICAVVTGKTIEEFLRSLDQAQKQVELVELRVDYLRELKLEMLEIIAKKVTKSAILTCRKQNEGGLYTGSEEERLEILQKAISMGFDYVDVELSSIESDDIDLGEKRGKLIVSYHNFSKTPKKSELEKILERMNACGADIKKIAVMANSDEDEGLILEMIVQNSVKSELIMIAMGDKGTKTRVLGPLLGGYLTYGSLEGVKTAPGQVSVERLKEIYNQFNLV